MNRLRAKTISIIACSFATSALHGQGWQIETNQYGVTSIEGNLTAKCGDISAPTHVRVYSHPTKSGLLGFDLTIQGISSFSEFHFNQFKGQNNPKGHLTFELHPSAGPKKFQAFPIGGNGPDSIEQFTFTVRERVDRPKSIPRLVIDQLATTDAPLIISIQDPLPPNQIITITFPPFDRIHINKLLAGLP